MSQKLHVNALPGGHAPEYVQQDWLGLSIVINDAAVKQELLEPGV